MFFYKKKDPHTSRMEQVFDTAMSKVTARADAIRIDVMDSQEKGIVDKLGVRRAPMPLVLALAPNGAITKGFPYRFDEKRLLEAFASPAMEKVFKALQEKKFVVLCVQNAKSEGGKSALESARAFKADKNNAKTSTIITLDPLDKAEASTLKQLAVDPKGEKAVTVLLVPPGKVAARFSGALKKEALMEALKKSCCPSG